MATAYSSEVQIPKLPGMSTSTVSISPDCKLSELGVCQPPQASALYQRISTRRAGWELEELGARQLVSSAHTLRIVRGLVSTAAPLSRSVVSDARAFHSLG